MPEFTPGHCHNEVEDRRELLMDRWRTGSPVCAVFPLHPTNATDLLRAFFYSNKETPSAKQE